MIKDNGIRFVKWYTKQIKCNFLNLRIMKSLSLVLFILINLNLFSQISYDTTYSKEWNQKAQEWVYFDRNITEFSGDNVLSELVQIYDNENWVNYNINLYYYNNSQLIEELEKYWNDSEAAWQESYRKLYSYEDGRISQVRHQYIFNGNYVDASREIYKYDEKGNLKEKVVQKSEEAWSNFLKYEYYYNTSDLIMEENLTYWDNNDWGDVDMVLTYTYDMNNNVIEKIKSKGLHEKGQFLIREEFFYTDNNLLEKQLISHWDSRKKRWIEKNRAEYASNMNGYIASALNQSKDKKEWENYLFTEFKGDNEPVTGIDIADGMTFSIYPVNFGKQAVIEFTNPYNEYFYVTVMNENGQLVGSAVTNNNEVAIDATDFHRGLYFIELQGSNLYSGKFSIE